MSQHFEWVDEMLRAWVAKCDDLVLLDRWVQTVKLRADEIRARHAYRIDELCAALDTAVPGDPLYPDKRLRVPWDAPAVALRTVVYLIAWDRSNRILDVCADQRLSPTDARRELGAREISFYQLATTKLHVRRHKQRNTGDRP